MIKNCFFLFLLSWFAVSIRAMKPQQKPSDLPVLPVGCFRNTFNGEPITPTSLAQIVPPLPEGLAKEVYEWRDKKENNDLLRALSMYAIASRTPLDECTRRIGLVQTSSYECLMRGACSNYVFTSDRSSSSLCDLVPFYPKRAFIETHVVKLASHSRRVLCAAAPPSYYCDLGKIEARDQYVSKLLERPLPAEKTTYLTLWRLLYFRRATQYIKEHGCTRIAIPPSYGVPLQGSSCGPCDDNHIFEVQEKVENFHPIRAGSFAARYLSHVAIKELFGLHAAVRIWDTAGDNLGWKDGKFYLIDMESDFLQNPPHTLFYTDAKTDEGDLDNSLSALFKIFTDPEQRRLLIECFDTNEIVQEAIKKGRLKYMQKEVKQWRE